MVQTFSDHKETAALPYFFNDKEIPLCPLMIIAWLSPISFNNRGLAIACIFDHKDMPIA